MNEKIRVWMVEDNEIYRDTVKESLFNSSSVGLERLYGSCEEMLDDLPRMKKPDVLLMDIGLPGMSGIDGVQKVLETDPKIKVIMFTVYQDNDRIFKAICNGASGYLLKNSDPAEIEKAILDSVKGGAPITPQIAKKVLDQFVNDNKPNRKYGLTDREREILTLLVEGLPKKGIAAQLHVSFYTIDTHIKNIYTKLQVHSGNEAVAKALRENLI